MTKQVDFYFDFASPNAYLSHKVIQSIKERTGATVNYIPVLLGGIFKLTNNKPPMEQFFGVKNKNEYQNIEMQRFIERHGLHDFHLIIGEQGEEPQTQLFLLKNISFFSCIIF